MEPTFCLDCGRMIVNEWPFCPHGTLGKHGVIGDDIPGGQLIENLDHEPMWFYSKKAIREAADARGLRMMDEWAGPHDKVLSQSNGVTEKRLRDVAELLSRGATTQKTDEVRCETAVFTVREVGR